MNPTRLSRDFWAFRGHLKRILAIMGLGSSLIAFQSSWGAETAYAVYPSGKDFYVSIGSMTCGQVHVLATSKCQRPDEPGGVPFCFEQTFDFIDEMVRRSNADLHYEHPYRSGEANFVTTMQCVESANRRFVVLRSTNFANCDSCEWDDVYDVAGHYLGSDGDSGRDLPQAFRPLEKRLARVATTPAAKAERSVRLDRNPK